MTQKTDTNTLIKPFPALTKALRNILYPFVHLLLKTGVTFPQLTELLKEIYIDVADNHFCLEDKKQTQTRLSFLTGIHRKDVKRLHKLNRDVEEPENVNVGVKLVSKWIKEPRYLDDKGNPLLLPLKSKDDPSFDELVKTICKQDIRSGVILDEWLNLGVVKLKNDHVQLCIDAFIPKEGLDEKAFFMGHNIADHLNAASQNLLNDTPEFFERCVYYDGLSKESVAELQAIVEEQGMKTLKMINDRASQLKIGDMPKISTKQRINVGLYFYHENQHHEDQQNENKNR